MRRPVESPVLFTATIVAVTLLSSPARSQAANSDDVTKKLIALTQRQMEVSEKLIAVRKTAWANATLMAKAGRHPFPTLGEIAWLDARLVSLAHRKTLHELQLRLSDATSGTRKSLLDVLKKRVSVAQDVVSVAKRHHESLERLLGSGRVKSPEVHAMRAEILKHTLVELSLRKDLIEVEARLSRK